jgi:hypothetical protein
MSDTQVEYKSEFLPEITIVIVFEDDPNYLEVKKYFDDYGYGFMVPGKNLIIIDGEELLDGDGEGILKFIEAHEVSHIILGHNGPRNEEEELEADLGAYLILKKEGYKSSISHLIDNFEDRHGIEFKEELLDKIREKMGF